MPPHGALQWSGARLPGALEAAAAAKRAAAPPDDTWDGLALVRQALLIALAQTARAEVVPS